MIVLDFLRCVLRPRQVLRAILKNFLHPFCQSFLRDLDPFRGRTSDVLQTDLYNLSLEIEPRDLPPKVYPRSNKDNLTIVPPKVVSLQSDSLLNILLHISVTKEIINSS